MGGANGQRGGGAPGRQAERAPPQVGGSGLPRAKRLISPRLFEETYAQGARVVGKNMVLWLRTGAGACLRLGVVAGRKAGGAVARNKAKRRLREVFRTSRALFAPGYDVVLVARRPIINASFAEARGELLELAEKINLLKHDGRQQHGGKNPGGPDKSL